MNDDLIEEIEELKNPTAILASRTSRIIAFILDLLLVMAFAFAVIGFLITPHYPGAIKELLHYSEKSQKDILQTISPQLTEMLQLAHTTTLLIFWIYFAASEIFMRGGSLGKAVFSIRVVNETTLEPPSTFDSIMRGGIKTFSLLMWTPFLLINYLLMFFTKKGQAGHDFLSRTIVIQGYPEEKANEEDNDNWE